MILIDLTQSLSEVTPVQSIKTPFSRKLCNKHPCYEDISLSSGIGTHMDAPSHFYSEGKSIDQISLQDCYGPAVVIHLQHQVSDNADYEITVADILTWEEKNGMIPEKSIVFFYTGWRGSMNRFPGLSAAAAELLVMRAAKGVGIDTTGIDPGYVQDGAAHRILLKNVSFLIENLENLQNLPPTGATVYLFPMKIKGAPEAPVRAIAFMKDALDT